MKKNTMSWLCRCSKCGGLPRLRYKIPLVWIECSKKCGMKTGYYADKRVPHDPASEAEAAEEWNRMVKTD